MNSPGAYVYLLHGDEGFGRDEALRGLKERMRALPAGEHNISELAGADASVANLRLTADQVPFLAERRMVVVWELIARLQGRGGRAPRGRSRNAPSSADEYEALLAYLPDVPPTSSIVFVESQAVQAQPILDAIPPGRAFERQFRRPRYDEVPGWIRTRARGLGVDLDEAAVRELAVLGGDDLRRLDNELHKLSAYANGRAVSRADVRELVVAREVVTWALLDALADRRADRALAALRRLYLQGEEPEALLLRDVVPLFRRLLLAKELSLLDRRERAAVDPGSLGLNPRAVPRLMEQADAFERQELERALELLLELDRLTKTGETDLEVALELMTVRLCGRLTEPLSSAG